jgi:hypothetical protein
MSFSDRGESSDLGPEETQEGLNLKCRDLGALAEIPEYNRGLRKDRLVKLEEKDRFID